MHNENELLAKWIGWYKFDQPQELGHTWKYDGTIYKDADLPNFRESNEWAGALFEKLEKEYEINFNPRFAHAQGLGFFYNRNSWRDTVVDAVLEILRRERNAHSATGDA